MSPPPTIAIAVQTRFSSRKLQNNHIFLFVHETLEVTCNLVTEFLEFGNENFSTEGRILELLSGQHVGEFGEFLIDGCKSDLAFAIGRVLNGLLGEIVVGDDVTEHPDCLVKGAVTIVVGESVLLKPIILDDLGDIEYELLGFTERVLSDKLHDLSQIVFELQDLLDLGSELDEIGVRALVVRLEGRNIFGIRDVPVEGG